MIDSHCHLDFAQFDEDRKQVLGTCAQAGIQRVLIPNTQAERLPQVLALTQQAVEQPTIDMAAGLHPWFLPNTQTDIDIALDTLEQFLAHRHPQSLAVGETGLDLVIVDQVDFTLQCHAFEAHIALATRFQLPLIVHQRKSHNELIRLLKHSQFRWGGVIHGFSGSVQVAEQYIEMGFLLGIGGTITYPRAQKTRQTLAQIAVQHLLLETDAPDMPMCGRQGKRNSPEFLTEVAQALAAIKQLSIEEVTQATTENYCRLFKLPDPSFVKCSR